MSSLFRRGGERGTQRGAPDGRNALVCPSCGLRNDPSAKFCRNCGLPLGWPQDPVRGTTTRRADLPSERGAGVASIIGLLAAVAVLVVAGFLVLRGSSVGGSPSPTRTASPGPSGVAFASPSVAPSVGVTTGPPVTQPPSPGVTDTPTQTDTPSPSTLPATTGFTCDTATIGDPTIGRWRVRHVTWKRADGYDSVILEMDRVGDSDRQGTILIETLTLAQVSAKYGMKAPPNADRAVVATFQRRVNGFDVSTLSTGMSTVRNVTIGQGSDSLWHVVLGVSGSGCHRIGVPAWNNDPTAQTAQLLIDVKK